MGSRMSVLTFAASSSIASLVVGIFLGKHLCARAIEAPSKKDAKEARKVAWDNIHKQVTDALRAWSTENPGQDFPQEVIDSQIAFARPRLPLSGEEAQDDAKAQLAASNFVRHIVKDFLKKEGPKPIARTPDEWAAIFPRYPTDEDGFAEAFEASDSENLVAALEKFGLVVVKVLDEEQCDVSVDALFEEINQRRVAKDRNGPTISQNDPSSWYTSNWPSGNKFLTDRPALHRQAFQNRCSPKIFEVFSAIFGGERKLHSTVDNWGVHRGSLENPKWSTGLKPHWDLNPWRYLEDRKEGYDPGYQGVLALTDQTIETGCHLTLPGCLHFLPQWVLERPKNDVSTTRGSWHAKPDDPILDYMQPIPLRKGTMVVWSWGQLHGSLGSQNTTNAMRLQQYIRLYPAPESGDERYERHDRYSCERVMRFFQKREELSVEDIKSFLPDSASLRLLGLKAYK